MRIKGLKTDVETFDFAPFIAYVRLVSTDDGRTVAETSTANNRKAIRKAKTDLKCGYLHIPVPKEDD